MINALLSGIFNVIISLVNVILSPIDALIKTAIPDLATAISAVGKMLMQVKRFIGWAIGATGLASDTFTIIIAYYTFKLTMPLAFSLIKSALKWYNKLKP